MKDWVEDLAGKNRILQFKIDELEEENKTLKLKLIKHELTAKSHLEETIIGHGAEGHGHEEVNPTSLPKEPRRESDVSNQDKQTAFPLVTVNIKTNPLEIETIVKHLMDFVSPMDLLTCRQVSKLWKKEAGKDFQERVTFHIGPLPQIKKFMECAGTGFPMFRNLRLNLDGCWPERKEDIRGLFLSYGKTLYKLQLNFFHKFYGNNWSLDDIRDIFLGCLEEIRELEIQVSPTNQLLGNQIFLDQPVGIVLQSLSVLKLELNRCGSTSVGYNTQVFLDLLHLAPNLKSLTWRSKEKCQGTQLIQCLIQVNPSKLENLFIQYPIPESAVQSLANSDLKLKELYLVDYKGFELKLVSTQSGKSEVILKQNFYGQVIWNAYMKTYLESLLKQFSEEYVSCTRLLQVATSFISGP